MSHIFELCTEQEERISDEVLGKYKTAFQKNEVQIIVDQISGYLVMVENDVTSKVHEIQWTLQHLHKIALKQSPLTQVQHFQFLTEAEKQGYQYHTKMHEQLGRNSRKAINNPDSLRLLKEQREAKIGQAKKASINQG